MRQISKIVLINFQGHKHSVFELHPGLNIFAGSNELGKSSILRALHWVFYDTWSESYIRVGENSCTVIVSYTDGHVIKKVRSRSGSTNEYQVTYPDGESETFAKFNRKVPKEVEQIHGMAEWVLDEGVVLNPKFRMHKDNTFLLFDSGITKAKAVGHIGGVHLFDAAIRDAQSELLELRRKEKKQVSQIEEVNARLKKLSGLDEAESLLASLQGKVRHFADLTKRYREIELYQQSINEARSYRTRLEQIAATLKELQHMENHIIELEKKIAVYDSLAETKAELAKVQNERAQAEKILASIKSLASSTHNLQALQALLERYQVIASHVYELKNVRMSMEGLTRRLTICRQISSQKERFDRLNNLLSFVQVQKWGNELTDIRRRRRRGKSIVEHLSQLSCINPTISSLQAKWNDYNNVLQLVEERRKLQEKRTKEENALKKHRSTLKQLEIEKEKAMMSLDYCPFCNSPIKKHDQQKACVLESS